MTIDSPENPWIFTLEKKKEFFLIPMKILVGCCC